MVAKIARPPARFQVNSTLEKHNMSGDELEPGTACDSVTRSATIPVSGKCLNNVLEFRKMAALDGNLMLA
jgi:hypothetical protein